MKSLIRKLSRKFAPITVCADWEHDVAIHKCWSRTEALEWAACYPVDAVILIRNRRNAVIAWRG
jgi:hypothetical protein